MPLTHDICFTLEEYPDLMTYRDDIESYMYNMYVYDDKDIPEIMDDHDHIHENGYNVFDYTKLSCHECRDGKCFECKVRENQKVFLDVLSKNRMFPLHINHPLYLPAVRLGRRLEIL